MQQRLFSCILLHTFSIQPGITKPVVSDFLTHFNSLYTKLCFNSLYTNFSIYCNTLPRRRKTLFFLYVILIIYYIYPVYICTFTIYSSSQLGTIYLDFETSNLPFCVDLNKSTKSLTILWFSFNFLSLTRAGMTFTGGSVFVFETGPFFLIDAPTRVITLWTSLGHRETQMIKSITTL